MKKLFTLFALFVTAIAVNAYDVVINDMCFNLDKENKTATFVQDESYVYQYLGDIVIPEKIEVGGTEYTVTGIGAYAFFYTKGITSLKMPETIETIGTYAFCYSVIEELTIPSKVKVIEPYTFSDCNDLRVINLPEGIEEIKTGAFYACKSLESITLPSTLKVIDEKSEWLFNLCTSLKEIHAKMAVPMSIPQNAFDQSTYDSAFLYVPTGTKAKYQETMYWDMFANILEEGDAPSGIDNASVDNVQDGAMYDLSGRRIYAPVKGLYIQNGKKIMAK